MKALIFAIISGMTFSMAAMASPTNVDVLSTLTSPSQTTAIYSSQSVEGFETVNSGDVQIMGVCCPVAGPACGWGDFPVGSECYCKHGNKVYPGTVCGK
ncbi:hypothetical protein ACLVWU_13435 [Bdellovibrio sp. HCB290]|uniref:hypothetical protein n=1 Tax=Bdellovibrio sp. HCB290 TaxID=3394356 RepID=UPI0039B4FF6E